RALKQLARVAAILDDIELEPERLAGRRPHLLDRADADRGQRERHAEGFRRLRRLDLAALRVHACKTDRRQRRRNGPLLAENAAARIYRGHIAQNALAQPYAAERRHIAGKRALLIGAAVDIIEKLPRQAAAGKFTIVGYGYRGQRQGHVLTLPFSRDAAPRTIGAAHI